MYRILAMDGGMTGYVTAEILRRMAQTFGSSEGHFLHDADVLAGTSAGAINALFLAAHHDPDEAIEDVQAFWGHILETSFTFRVGRLVPGLMGARALGSRQRMQDYLIDYFGSETRLGDLETKVIITAFEIDHLGSKSSQQVWRPRLFHNIAGLTDYSPDARVVDVAMRSSNLPVVSPIYTGLDGGEAGYLDGGFVANNPSMCAISAILENHRRQGIKGDPDKISVLSIGCGRQPFVLDQSMVKDEADWGYVQWLLAPSNPMLLLRLAVRGATDMINYQCEQLLGENFKRVDPTLHASPHLFDVAATKQIIDRALKGPEIPAAVEETCAWLLETGWETNLAKDAKATVLGDAGGKA